MSTPGEENLGEDLRLVEESCTGDHPGKENRGGEGDHVDVKGNRELDSFIILYF